MDNTMIYISGNISVQPTEHSRFKILSATKELRSRGYIVRSPLEVCADLDQEDFNLCMKRRLAEMINCTIVLMLDEWFESKEAAIEYNVCKQLSIPTEMYSTYINRLNLKPIE